MKTFWISFKKGPGRWDVAFDDYSQGNTIEDAVKRLGRCMNQVAEWRELEPA
jgi:hypothetical protein